MSETHHHPAALEPAALLAQCEVRRSRASGPGGQNRNKVETAIELTHKPTSITGWASERRSQGENQKVALFRLRVNLALEVRAGVNLAGPQAPPSRLWQSRTSGGRIAINPSHDDFPSLLAEALDVLAACRFDLSKAAILLAVSATQLVKLLKIEPRALRWVNDQRAMGGLSRLL